MKKLIAVGALSVLIIGIYASWGSILQVEAKVRDYFSSDPDLPPGSANVDKSVFLAARDEWVMMKRGYEKDLPFDPAARDRAITKMADDLRGQEHARGATLNGGEAVSVAGWRAVGPAPLPLGQTETRIDPVTGRVISIAVHPTNPDIVYVGTATGGLYRTLNGTAASPIWTPMMDTVQLQSGGLTALGTLSIGAIAFAPSNPDIVYVGTGEQLTGYFGSGLYRIDNASQASPTLAGPINPSVDYGNGVTGTFTMRAISKIVVHPTQPGTVFLSTSSGGGGLSTHNGSPPPNSVPPEGVLGVYRTTNATSSANTVSFTKFTVNTEGGFATGNTDVSDLVFDKSDATANTLVVWVRSGNGADAACAVNCAGIYRSTNAMTTGTFTRQLTALNGNTRGELTSAFLGGISTILVATGEAPAATGSNPNACAANQLGLVRRSVDGGATWPSSNSAAPAAGGIIRSADGFCGGQCFYDVAIEVDPTTASTIQIGGSGNYGGCQTVNKRSTDGVTFALNSTGLHADVQVIAASPSNHLIVWTGNDGGLWRSNDAGANWTSMNGDGATTTNVTGRISATQYVSIATHPTDREFMAGGTQDNGTHLKRSAANAGAWSQIAFGDGGYTAIDQNAADTANVKIYHTYYNLIGTQIQYEFVGTTADAETKNWTTRDCVAGGAANTRIDCNDTAVLFYAPMVVGPGNPNTLYFGTDRLYRSADGGSTMQLVSQASPAGAGVAVSSISIGSNDNFRIIGMRNGKVYATTSGSATLTDVTPAGAPAATVGKVIIDANTTNAGAVTAYLAYGGFGTTGAPIPHMWKTTNLAGGSATWTQISTGLPDIPVNAIAIDRVTSTAPTAATTIYIGTDIGVYQSTNGGTSWAVFNVGNKLPVIPVFDLAFQGNNNSTRILRAGTHGRGIWEYNLSPTSVARSDFDGDGRTDFSIFRPSEGNWYLNRSTAGFAVNHFGAATDRIVLGDFDGDKKTDLAVWRPSNVDGAPDFYVLKSSDSTLTGVALGVTTDVPVVADYDGDGKDDYAVWRPSTGDFYVLQSQSGSLRHYNFGINGDKPVPADYDGDGKADFAVFRPSTGNWYVARSIDNAVIVTHWGLATDIPVYADYDGDQKTDIAVFRPSDGFWYILRSGGGASYIPFGTNGDVPVPGDYDGDGKTDQAIYRNGTWYVNNSTAGFLATAFGVASDTPTPRNYLPQ